MYQRQVTFKEAVESALKSNYCNFDGRASRSQYWWFYLFQIIVSSVLYCLSPILGSAVTTLATLVNLALLLPALGLCFRRLHDTGKSGWWILISLTGIGIFVLLFFFAQNSEMRTNEYGPVPNIVD